MVLLPLFHTEGWSHQIKQELREPPSRRRFKKSPPLPSNVESDHKYGPSLPSRSLNQRDKYYGPKVTLPRRTLKSEGTETEEEDSIAAHRVFAYLRLSRETDRRRRMEDGEGEGGREIPLSNRNRAGLLPPQQILRRIRCARASDKKKREAAPWLSVARFNGTALETPREMRRWPSSPSSIRHFLLDLFR